MAHSIAVLLIVGAFAVAIVGTASIVEAASGKKSKMKHGGDQSRAFVLEGKRQRRRPIRRRSRAPVIAQPIGPSYVYYDYPYYYSRGHYPTHIAQYVYYFPRASHPRQRSRYIGRRSRCARRSGRC